MQSSNTLSEMHSLRWWIMYISTPTKIKKVFEKENNDQHLKDKGTAILAAWSSIQFSPKWRSPNRVWVIIQKPGIPILALINLLPGLRMCFLLVLSSLETNTVIALYKRVQCVWGVRGIPYKGCGMREKSSANCRTQTSISHLQGIIGENNVHERFQKRKYFLNSWVFKNWSSVHGAMWGPCARLQTQRPDAKV